MLTFDAMRVIEAIQRRGSFAAAAAELDRVPSAISYTVQKLEEELGLSLFRKEGRRAVLTPAGQALASGAVKMMTEANQLTHQIKQIATGWEPALSIAIDTTVNRTPVWQAVEKLYAVHPSIELSISEQVLGGTWEALFNDSAGLIIGAVENLPDQYQAARQGIRVLPWTPLSMCFVAAPGHPICKTTQPISIDVIQSYRGVAIADTSSRFKSLNRGQFHADHVLYVDNMHEKLMAHLRGIGIGLLPRHLAAPYLESGKLVALEIEAGVHPEPTSIAFRTNNKGRSLQFLVEQLTTNES